ncbi:MAG: group I truncated hemoglobin, partial [Candidatus Xenobia bacterium]
LRPLLDDFYDRLLADPALKDRFSGTNVPRLKNQVLDFVGEAIGGPQHYHGADMRSSHQKMRITPAEWDLTMKHLGESLNKFHVAPREQEDMVAVVESLRSDIVYEPNHVDAPSMANRPGARNLYDRAGEVFLQKAFDEFWSRLQSNPDLAPCVAGLDEGKVKTQTLQLVQEASGDLTLHDIPTLKATLKATPEQWPRVRALLGECLDKYYIGQTDRDSILDIVSDGPTH